MLLLTIVAVIATRSFYRKAKDCGKHPGKAASLPFFGLCLPLIADYLATHVLTLLSQSTELSDPTYNAIVFMQNIFVIAIYVVFLRKNHQAISSS